MLKLGHVNGIWCINKGRNLKTETLLLQGINWRGEICAINFQYFRDGGRVWCVNKGWNRKTETFPFSGHTMKGVNFER